MNMSRIAAIACVISLAAAARADTDKPCGCRIVSIAAGSTAKVQPQPPPNRKFEPMRAAQIVRFGDALYIDGSVVAVCDGKGRQLIASPPPPKNRSVPCVANLGTPHGRYRKRDTSTLRTSSSLAVPYVLTPRGTKLITDRPMIRWSAIPGAKSYRVTIRSDDPGWKDWSRVVEATSESELGFRYPADAPPLRPGPGFKVVVTSQGRSSDDGEPNRGFKIAQPDEGRNIQEALEQLRAMELPPESNAVVAADLYSAAGFFYDAIETLRPVAISSRQPDAYRALADLYLEVGLIDEAENVLETVVNAEDISKADGQAAQADSLRLLADFAKERGEKDRAASLLDRANKIDPVEEK